MKLRCIIVDDDRIQRNIIEEFISDTNLLEVTGSFENVIDSKTFLDEHQVDIVFLDIEMPKNNGMELLKTINPSIKIIMVSSKEKYALESYEYNVTDYLLKPVTYERFTKAIHKLTDKEKIKSSNSIKEIFVKSNSLIEKIKLKDILYIEAAVDYVSIVTNNSKHLVNTSMNAILNKLPQKDFFRVHRSHIIRVDKIDKIEDDFVYIGNKTIHISKSYKNEVMGKINLI